MRLGTSLLALFAPALLAGGAWADRPIWYEEGHRLVARLAATRLTPRAAAAIRDLLGGESLADAALWADRIREQRRDTGPLHYVNMPLAADRYLPERDCPGGQCIIAAIARDRCTLADGTAAPAMRAEALRFLIHFIGDLHQPLHTSDNGDHGGNDRMVRLLGMPMNLHRVWDGEMMQRSGLDEARYYEHLRSMMDTLDLSALEHGGVIDWAMEGHRIVAEHVYRLPADGALDSAYVASNLPLVDRALIAAGVRLARVLNDALAAYPPAPEHHAPARATLTDREAAAHVGDTATVVGTVVSVHRSRGGNLFLNFGADYPHQTFSAAVLHPEGEWTPGLDSLVGRLVGVRGLIERYQGSVQIRIERTDQILPPAPPPAAR